ncbi:hypothetical protein Rleg2_1146 [Rhizobium leguminosarum bv. trifolii WSM2304]|uniref:Scaffolding protein n=1 Tax=Rhizobium leguminosarum bv. trifolii (strain WSM2304) TaxID=395492 RepID=A0ABF7QKR2_RHILW|nr:hypothetical protein [Rhizobium leguminosarum]ACI54440.1 hypothetical protein Rleg2_1146 [Rhizobium leguminosarum bv. trifolii WSM2304]
MDEQQLEQLAEDNVEETEAEEVADGEADGDGADNTETTQAETAQEDERDATIAALKAQLKSQTDKNANLKGKAEALRRVVKKQKDANLLEDSDIEGVDPKEFHVWVDNGLERDAVNEKLVYFDQNAPKALPHLTEKYGDVQTVDRYVRNYNVLLQNDPDERAKLDGMPDSLVVEYIISRGKAADEELSDLTTEGNALAVIRKLKKQVAELQAGQGVTEVRKPKTSVNTPSVVVKQPVGTVYADL